MFTVKHWQTGEFQQYRAVAICFRFASVFTCLYKLGHVGPGGEIWGDDKTFLFTNSVSEMTNNMLGTFQI